MLIVRITEEKLKNNSELLNNIPVKNIPDEEPSCSINSPTMPMHEGTVMILKDKIIN